MLLRLALLLAVWLAPLAARAQDTYDIGPDRPYFVRSLHKLGRGALNAVTFPTEIPLNAIKEWQLAENRGGGPYDEISAALWGNLSGAVYAVVRAGVAVFDVATFVVPSAPLMAPATPMSLWQRISNRGCAAPPQDSDVC